MAIVLARAVANRHHLGAAGHHLGRTALGAVDVRARVTQYGLVRLDHRRQRHCVGDRARAHRVDAGDLRLEGLVEQGVQPPCRGVLRVRIVQWDILRSGGGGGSVFR